MLSTIYALLCIIVPCSLYQLIICKRQNKKQENKAIHFAWVYIFLLYIYLTFSVAGICSSYDYDLLTNKIEMTLKDYQRITYLVGSLGYSQYLQFLIGKYMDLAQADEEQEEREHEIYLEYPEYYEDEGILEEEEKWLEEFLNQLPENKREYFERLIKESQSY